MSLNLSPDCTVKELFLEACEGGKLDLVRPLLAHNADVNWKQDKGNLRSGLHLAVRGDHGDLLDLLLSQTGVDVNIRDKYNMTPLMRACGTGLDNMVRKLLKVDGVDLNLMDNKSLTALHWATFGNNPGCVELLKGAGGLDWNIQTVSGNSPLMLAVYRASADCLQVLLLVPGPSVDLTVEDCDGKDVAWLAVESTREGAERCVQLLCQDPRVNWGTRDGAGDTPLMFCLKNNKTEMARVLLSNPKVKLQTKNYEGKYPETIAREENLKEILGLMESRREGIDMASESECPVCFEKFNRNSEVHQCQEGHFVCRKCRPRVRDCPTCRGRMMGRAHGFEEHLQGLHI